MTKPDFNWTNPPKPVPCAVCGKTRSQHKARTLNCPKGMKTRIGYIEFHDVDVYTSKDKTS